MEASGTSDLLRNIKRGRSNFPRGDNLKGLARVLDVSTDWLTSLVDEDDDAISSEDVAAELDGNRHVESADIAADSTPIDPDEQPTIGSETGRRGIPKDGTAQLDVTAGMGGGGLTIINSGIAGKSGMTFAAEHVRDFWRLPPEVLAGMGLRAHDIIVMAAQGDSMLPTLNEGDFVFVDTRHRLPSPDGLYAITDEFGGMVVKRLEVAGREDDDIRVRIISDNAERHPPKDRLLSEMQIIGRVVRRFGIV
ncbi:S24 family peptidase [Ancylobacter mangrovi]|uniref:S24 family peptidase n=1 Tax=Ancylobacter mangrovi TaxID=2972472 RepID=UPI002161D95A|nr:S24 family peptidase [Ancylobacter mangrovi]MCS0501410.1 LexA family transcriptional regulator [Ancylobacter mangrovi]